MKVKKIVKEKYILQMSGSEYRVIGEAIDILKTHKHLPDHLTVTGLPPDEVPCLFNAQSFVKVPCIACQSLMEHAADIWNWDDFCLEDQS